MLFPVLDVETTGLNEKTDKLLEIAIVIIDDNFVELDRISQVIHYNAIDVHDMRKAADPYVQNMHDANGLWREIIELGPHLNTVDLMLSEWLKTRLSTWEFRTVGNSLRLDLNFIEEHLPKTYEVLGYRSIDMSGVDVFVSTFTGNTRFSHTAGFNEAKARANHRALDDVLLCIQQMKYTAVALGWRVYLEEI